MFQASTMRTGSHHFDDQDNRYQVLMIDAAILTEIKLLWFLVHQCLSALWYQLLPTLLFKCNCTRINYWNFHKIYVVTVFNTVTKFIKINLYRNSAIDNSFIEVLSFVFQVSPVTHYYPSRNIEIEVTGASWSCQPSHSRSWENCAATGSSLKREAPSQRGP